MPNWLPTPAALAPPLSARRPDPGLERLLRAAFVIGGVFVVAYLATGRWLRIRELGELLGPVLRRVPRLGAAYGGRGRA